MIVAEYHFDGFVARIHDDCFIDDEFAKEMAKKRMAIAIEEFYERLAREEFEREEAERERREAERLKESE